MAKFFKATNRLHPKHKLPTVQWSDDKPLFEFHRGKSGFLEFETGNPEVIAKMREMGYDEEPSANLSASPPAEESATITRPPVKKVPGVSV